MSEYLGQDVLVGATIVCHDRRSKHPSSGLLRTITRPVPVVNAPARDCLAPTIRGGGKHSRDDMVDERSQKVGFSAASSKNRAIETDRLANSVRDVRTADSRRSAGRPHRSRRWRRDRCRCRPVFGAQHVVVFRTRPFRGYRPELAPPGAGSSPRARAAAPARRSRRSA